MAAISKIYAHAKEWAAISGFETQDPSLDGQVAFAQHTYHQLDFAQKKNQIFVCQLGVGHFQCGHHPIFMCWPNEF